VSQTEFHLLRCAICQLTNPFNIVHLASLAHLKGITLSGETRGLEEEVRITDKKAGKENRKDKTGIFLISSFQRKPFTFRRVREQEGKVYM